eukprot:216548_1
MEITSLLLVASFMCIPIFSDDCIFLDSISHQYKLDLSPIANKELKWYEGSSNSANNWYNYSYSVCANDLYCVPKFQSPAHVMISQYAAHLGECYWLAQWDNGRKQPTYDPRQQLWTFEYTGMPCDSDFKPERNTTVHWHCNATVEYEISRLIQTSACEYLVFIESKYACPVDSCTWSVPNKGVLDLTALSKTTVIISQDTSEDALVFVYTPCRNGSRCGGLDVMVKLDNVTSADSSACDAYLAIWEESSNNDPTYDDQKGIWKFEYKNGQICNGLDSSLFVYWYCDETLIDPPYYKTLYGSRIAPCLYDIGIASPLACHKSN